MFIDEASIRVVAGAGGDGAATFRREAHVPRGGPDGGDGGRGGSVLARVDPGQTTLSGYRHARTFRAKSGGRGAGQKRHGASASDLVIPVPPGTAIFDDETGLLIADLVERDQQVIVGRGGRGGLGNVHFATAVHRAPRHAQKGEPGEERRLRLELRLIADVGLVGLPNAGKSTLLAALTAARPRIAPYPFTTLAPNLGVLDLGDADARRPTIADLPGLIEGASGGAGLGHAFLRHVERTRLLVHVVDGDEPDPESGYRVIREELRAHDPLLLSKPSLAVLNKLDLPDAAKAWPAFEAARASEGLASVAVSARSGLHLDRLCQILGAMLPDAATLARPPEPPGVVVHRPGASPASFTIEVEPGGGFRVHGRRIERLAVQTDFGNEESASRFQRDLVRLGVDGALRRAGVRSGDVVRIGRQELEWSAE